MDIKFNIRFRQYENKVLQILNKKSSYDLVPTELLAFSTVTPVYFNTKDKFINCNKYTSIDTIYFTFFILQSYIESKFGSRAHAQPLVEQYLSYLQTLLSGLYDIGIDDLDDIYCNLYLAYKDQYHSLCESGEPMSMSNLITVTSELLHAILVQQQFSKEYSPYYFEDPIPLCSATEMIRTRISVDSYFYGYSQILFDQTDQYLGFSH